MCDSSVSPHDLKVKYLATLESLTKNFGEEIFKPISLLISAENERLMINYEPIEKEQKEKEHEVMVAGSTGIKWRRIPKEVSGIFPTANCFL